ncbi:hypothetical protein [Rhizobacter sp. P5_C2]
MHGYGERNAALAVRKFQALVRRRRTLHLLWWIPGALLVVPLREVFNLLPRDLFTFEPGMAFGLLTWAVVWLWLGRQLTKTRCPYCCERAFGPRPFVSVRRMRCVSCQESLFD